MNNRTIQEVRPAHASRDGDGVAIQRITGMQHAAMDPILMIDELRSEYREDFAGGFPPHPHRGMQTLTYMKRGGIIHEDNQGNRGEIRGGGAQWMSAGSGVIHSEMPTQDTEGLHGFQIWINLPATQKMSTPRYRDIPAAELAQRQSEAFNATAIAGDWVVSDTPISGPLHELAEQASILDLQLDAGNSATIEAHESESLIAYVYDGSVLKDGVEITAKHLLISSRGDRWTVQAGPEGAALLVLRGEPLREPVAHYGPFVMNTPEEIEQALQDYQQGRFVRTAPAVTE